jgi:hypothetical protein
MKRTITAVLVCLAVYAGVGCAPDSARDIGRSKQPELSVPSVSVSLHSEGPFTIADPIDVALNIYHRKKDRVGYPETGDDLVPFVLVQSTAKTSRVKADLFKTMIIYTVRIYDTGEFSFGPIRVTVDDRALSTEKLPVSILSVIPKNDPNPEMKDIVGPYRPRMKRIMFLIIPLTIIGAAAAAFALRRLLQKKPGSELQIIAGQSTIDPYDLSIAELSGLKKEYGRNGGEVKLVYSKLSIVLRYFVGNVLEFNALMMTTGEIRRYLSKNGTALVPTRRLMSILKRSDLVKFAKEKPNRDRIEGDISESIEIVRKMHGALTERPQEGETG